MNSIVLSPTERETLERWQRSTTLAAGLARRGKIIRLLADHYSQSDVAQLVGVQRGVRTQVGQTIPGAASGGAG